MTKTNAAVAKLSAHAGSSGPGAGTGLTRTATGGGSLDDAEAEKPAAPDEPLMEAERILVDYLSVVPKGNLVTTGH